MYIPRLMIVLVSIFLYGNITFSQEIPQTEISNGLIHAKLYLPDSSDGYYQSTRFDWSGVMPSLEHDGHQYFGKWFDKYNPKTHDAIMGPVEEFGPVGYDEPAVGERFLKIGVGTLVKPEEEQYNKFKTYEIANHGHWEVIQNYVKAVLR